jgi:signal transduction histidine kinase
VDFEYVYSNREGLLYLNLSPEQHQGLRLSTTPTLTTQLREFVMAELIEVFTTGRDSKTDVYNPVLDKYARVLRTRLRDGVLTVIQDRTEEIRMIKLLEEKTRQLEDQKTLLDNILKNSSNGISVSRVFRDAKGAVVDAQTILANDSAVKFIGLPKDVYLSKRATEIEPAIIGSPYYQACIKTLETGEPFMMQYHMQSTGRWLELTVSKLDYDHLIQVFTDITPIKEAQLQLEQSVEKLKQSNQNLEQFAYAASHDLKEPVRKINYFSERLREDLHDTLTTNQKILFDRMDHACRRMQVLIDDLLEYSHISMGAHLYETIDLNTKVRNVLQDLELTIQEKRAIIKVDPLPTVNAHRRQMQQLFQNLIGNALKYHKNGIPPEIHIRSRQVRGIEAREHVPFESWEKEFYLIEVEDKGIGFEEENAERIFTVFTRLHGHTEYTGTGVGLSIVRKVVQNHGGYVFAESKPGQGSVFKILLPRNAEGPLKS